MYHHTVYPSVVLQPGTVDYTISNQMFSEWRPLFDQLNVTLAFENHFHIYKRTVKVYDNKPSKNRGTVYIGDGGLGIISGKGDGISTNPLITQLVDGP